MPPVIYAHLFSFFQSQPHAGAQRHVPTIPELVMQAMRGRIGVEVKKDALEKKAAP